MTDTINTVKLPLSDEDAKKLAQLQANPSVPFQEAELREDKTETSAD